jgi:hypothetical protein
MASQLEKFLKGEPLTPELEQLAARVQVASKGETKDSPEPEESVSRSDRERLKRLFNDPGWEILMRLLDQRLDSARQKAVLISEQSPEEVVGMKEAWTYIKAFKAVRMEIELILATAVRENEQ